MTDHQVVSREAWLESRKLLLDKEKSFTKERDQLSQARREMPWVKVEKDYEFEGENGTRTLAELFDDNSQLVVFHFMFGVDWEEGCPSCSFWADNINGTPIHLQNRDATFVAISNSALQNLTAYRARMGWSFDWYSSVNTNFNQDFNVSFSAEELENGNAVYNYREGASMGQESPGMSIFTKDAEGNIYHTYSCYARGLDMLNGAYHIMDLLPKGRDEQNLPFTMSWLRRNDQY